MTIARLGLVAALALAAVACAPPQTRIASEVTWSRADPVAMAVAPGDIVRIEATRPIDVTSVLCGPQGEADVTTVLAPKDGLVYLRPALGTTALGLALTILAVLGANVARGETLLVGRTIFISLENIDWRTLANSATGRFWTW